MSTYASSFHSTKSPVSIRTAKSKTQNDILQQTDGIPEENVFRCMQCGRCSAGCPVHESTDLAPNQIWKLLQLGEYDRALHAKHLWLCVGCHACSARCPNHVDPASILDSLRVQALAQGIEPPPRVKAFHDAFLDTLKKKGRVGELQMMSRFYMKQRVTLDDVINGYRMFKSGRLKLFSGAVRDQQAVRGIFSLKTPEKEAIP